MKKILAVILSLVVLGACIRDEEPEIWSLEKGASLPAFSVTTLDGQQVTTSDLLGTVSVICLFNTACPDCQKELPILQQVFENFSEKSVTFLCISREEGAASVEQFWRENGLTMPVSAQTDRRVYSLFANSVIPRIYIADSRGVITAIYSDSPLPTASTLITAISSPL